MRRYILRGVRHSLPLFILVFEPLIASDLKISAEEIETSLITPNNDLARLHIALLKGIPPVNRNMTDGDAWVTIVCKKLAPWWSWVVEGENPIKVDHGKEIQRYKALDPITRMVIMKALCEVRVQQDDVLRHITDKLKKGTKVTTFRKERIGGVDNRVSYWHDGDPVIGHRLYKEIVQAESKLNPRGKGRAAEPTNAYQWETVATELEEFQKISDNLSSSKSNAEAVLGEMIKTEIVPVLEVLQKKKERALKRQQREVLQLTGFSNYGRVGVTRSCRERRPVRYTFDDYDRSIDEAIHISKKLKTTRSKKDNVVQVQRVTSEQQSENDEDGDSDETDEEHGERNVEEDDDFASSDAEKKSPKLIQKHKNAKTKAAVGIRRSQRFVEPTEAPAQMKKRPRQRPTRNSAQIVSDSEDDSSPEGDKQVEIVPDSEMEDSAASGDGSREDSGDASDE